MIFDKVDGVSLAREIAVCIAAMPTAAAAAVVSPFQSQPSRFQPYSAASPSVS